MATPFLAPSVCTPGSCLYHLSLVALAIICFVFFSIRLCIPYQGNVLYSSLRTTIHCGPPLFQCSVFHRYLSPLSPGLPSPVPTPRPAMDRFVIPGLQALHPLCSASSFTNSSRVSFLSYGSCHFLAAILSSAILISIGL